MNLTERDICVVDFINTYKSATTKMIVDLYYNNYNVGTRRLKMLVDNGYIKRSRIATGEWLYHSDDGNSLELIKELMITNLAMDMQKNGYTLGDVYYNKEFSGVETNAQIAIKHKNNDYMLLVHSELKGHFDTSKYKGILDKDSRVKGYTPIVVVIDNKPIDLDVEYNIVRLSRDISNIDTLLNKLEELNE